LRVAIRHRCTGVVIGGFPKYVWAVINGDVYEARHINGPKGDYKGYKLEPVEYPNDPDGRLILP
jgi:hypothetical protein